jgi:hypothetical protein
MAEQRGNEPQKLVLTASDDERLVRYLELLIKIDKRMKKGQGNEQPQPAKAI